MHKRVLRQIMFCQANGPYVYAFGQPACSAGATLRMRVLSNATMQWEAYSYPPVDYAPFPRPFVCTLRFRPTVTGSAAALIRSRRTAVRL